MTIMVPTSAPVSGASSARRWWILALLSAAQFMLIIDVTVVNVALPSIAGDLGLDRAGLTWIVTAYTLLFGSLLVLGGRLADRYGRRRMFLIGLGLFVVASLGAALAANGTMLIVARSFQGIAAAALSPAALSLVTTTFTGSERNRALAVWAALGGAGAAVGVILGGALTTGFGWEWIFLINVPVGLVVGVAVARLVPAVAAPRQEASLDLPGGAAFALGVASLFWAIIDAGSTGWTDASTLARIGLGGAFLAVFAWRERSTPRPLIRLELLADRAFSGAAGLMLTGSVLLGGMIFLSTLYLQLGAGFSAIETGLMFLPMAIALIAGSQWAAFYIGHHGQRGSATTGFIGAGAGLLYLSRLPSFGDVLVDVLPGLLLAGFGIGATFVSATTAAFTRIPEAEAGRASGLVNTSHELGLALGAALASTIGGAGLTGLPAAGAGFGPAFLATVVIAVAGVIGARLLMPTRASAPGRPVFAH